VPRLIVIKGADEGKQFELTDAAIGIGRDSSNLIRLTDTEVSRRHAEVLKTAEGFRLLDRGSANGTFINTKPIKDVLLQPGDHVQIGQSVLVFSAQRLDQSAASDLAARIDMITRQEPAIASAIVKTIEETEGGRILSRPDQVKGSAWLKNSLGNLGILYEATQAVNQILDVNQLLERLMDLVLKSIVADRACIMLRNSDSGELEPKALRWRQGLHEDKMEISRTVMDHVLTEKQGVLVSDATRDERFSGGQSIVRFGIHEVICVPMKGRHETLGVLYLDTRTTARDIARRRTATAKFTEDHLALAIALGHQAALAIENTRYYQAMVNAERLAAVGQTITALSHHIKNILQGLRSGGDIVKMGLKDRDDNLLHRGWVIVEKNQARIYDLVLDMLSYSKDRQPNVESVDLNGIVRDVAELLDTRAQELNIKLETRLDEKMQRIQADPEGVHRSLLNIVGNAFDALEGRPDPRVILATSLEEGGEWARIVVADNGVGIPAEKLNDIFKPFVSTKGSKGTGLGLPVSRKILREHGGDIAVHSQLGKGSRFTLRLPVRSPFASESMGTNTQMPAMPPPEAD
jgi:signal transduction histidine kinase/pSer/pThr/pTyr-binding forkhead associated (FHA) protein